VTKLDGLPCNEGKTRKVFRGWANLPLLVAPSALLLEIFSLQGGRKG